MAASERVELRSQPASVIQSAAVQAGVEDKAARPEVGDGWVACGKGGMADTEIIGAGHEGLAGNSDISGHAVGLLAPDMAGDHAEIGMIRQGGGRGVGSCRGFSGKEFDRAIVVGRHLMMQRSHQRELVGDLRLKRKDFADFHAWHSRMDRLERPAYGVGGVGLGVPGFILAGAAPHPEKNDGCTRVCLAGNGPGREQVG